MNNLEYLLQQKDTATSFKDKEVVPSNIHSKVQKADKTANLFDFITMISKIITVTMDDVIFIPDEGKVLQLDSMKKKEKSIITYKVISRESKGELKPRVRETIFEKDENKNQQRVGEIWGQKFKCKIQFNIFASVYKEAEEVMEKFEDTITMFLGYFKKNGVAEIIFDKHFTDDSYSNLRETLSIRNLSYYVEVEKLTVIFKEKIKEIELLVQKKEEL